MVLTFCSHENAWFSAEAQRGHLQEEGEHTKNLEGLRASERVLISLNDLPGGTDCSLSLAQWPLMAP